MVKHLDWHRECLKNQYESAKRKKAAAFSLLEQIDRDDKDIKHYAAQIQAAEAEGKDGFDGDKYKKVKK